MKPNIENINKAIAVLQRIPLDHFDMNYFQWSPSVPETITTEKQILKTCDSVCCFSGWLRVSKEFRKLQDPRWVNMGAFVLKIPDDYQNAEDEETGSIAILLGIPNDLASAIIYSRMRLYHDMHYIEDETEEIEPSHIIRILEDIRDNPHRFDHFED